ncbi:uncharacterized protein VNE69_08174 [Vairimorpha necatrix]|uniref:Uncharacterized protein n=1 Tax=Vairimorpha necatrix TaxID=6039 RepID=A0AAX4JEQ4_9MICR
MYLYILVGLSSKYKPTDGFLMSSFELDISNEIPLDLSCKPKHKEVRNKSKTIPKKSTRHSYDVTYVYKREGPKNNCSASMDDSNMLCFVLDFIKRTKTKYLNTENVSNLINRTYIYKNLLEGWKSEPSLDIYYQKPYKFNNLERHQKYTYMHKYINIYLLNFSKIVNQYMPIIKNEIEISSIQDVCKNNINGIIKNISYSMSYFDQLKPKYLNYIHHSNTLKCLYTLMYNRFPYLFDYFNLFERYINLYELIIENYVKKVSNSSKMIATLYPMSSNITYIVRNRVNFFKYIQNSIELLGNLQTDDEK